MKILKPGIRYELPAFENPSAPGLTVQFIEKYASPDSPPDSVATVRDGVTNEAVLEMLIDRMHFLERKFPCRENAFVLMKLEEALMWMERRSHERHERGVSGKNLP